MEMQNLFLSALASEDVRSGFRLQFGTSEGASSGKSRLVAPREAPAFTSSSPALAEPSEAVGRVTVELEANETRQGKQKTGKQISLADLNRWTRACERAKGRRARNSHCQCSGAVSSVCPRPR